MRGSVASRVDGDVADAGGPLCDAQLAGTRGHVTAILTAHVRDAGADPRLRCLAHSPLRRLYRVRLTVHHRRLTRAQLRHRCRVHVFAFSFVRCGQPSRIRQEGGSARVVIFYSGGYAHQRRTGEPRGCGEYVYHRDWCLIPSGSSPRGRGKPRRHSRQGPRRRLIPARAGKTSCPSCLSSGKRAHPRAVGENRSAATPIRSLVGSSPRGRGKPRCATCPRTIVGLIPARAGKTLIPTLSGTLRPAHPRAGGENDAGVPAGGRSSGSSTRGRGKRYARGAGDSADGLIPARAGKTKPFPPPHPSGRAHPRAGGENLRCILSRGSELCSSPRGRGKREVLEGRNGDVRLIPARAGKTGSVVQRIAALAAHPRAGGENPIVISFCPFVSGSSPRGRRKLVSSGGARAGPRLIPARAGKTDQGR